MCSCFNYKFNPFNSFLDDLIMLGDRAKLTGECEYKEYTVVNLSLSSALEDCGLPPRLAEDKHSGTPGRTGVVARLRYAQFPISSVFSFLKPLRNTVVSHFAENDQRRTKGLSGLPEGTQMSCHSRGLNFHVQSLCLLCYTQRHSPHQICAQRHVPSNKNQQNSRGTGCLKAPSSCNHTWFSMDCPRAQHGIMVSEQSSHRSRATTRKAKRGLTLFRIFLPASITTYTITLSMKLRSPSRLMMEHSRPFSTLGMIADGSVLHHSDGSPWVQRYFISLQHVSAFTLPMMIIQ